MHVQVEHFLSAARAIVDHDPETIVRPLLASEPRRRASHAEVRIVGMRSDDQVDRHVPQHNEIGRAHV